MLGTLTTKGKQQNKKQSEGWEEKLLEVMDVWHRLW